MRSAAPLILALVVAAQPLPAAEIARSAAGARVVLPSAPLGALPIPDLPAGVDLPPSVSAAIAAPTASPEILASRLEPVQSQPSRLLESGLSKASAEVSRDVEDMPRLSGEGASASGDLQIRRLLGEKAIAASAFEPGPAVSADAGSGGGSAGLAAPPAAPRPPRDPAVTRMIRATMAFKLGMEAMTTSVPFVAMKILGGATSVALLVVVAYGVAQAVSGSFSGALTDRFRANRVLSAAVLAQGVGAGVILAASAASVLSPWLLFPVYAAIGAAVGLAETSRRVIPPLIVGQDQEALRRYNGRLHRFYETAGVAGSALAGLLIWRFGALSALWVTPPAALAAAAVFWRVSHPFTPRPREGAAESLPRRAAAAIKSYLGDLKIGARGVFADSRMRWLALAMVLPQIVHRVFENLLLPVYAKGILGQEALSAALLTASNLGELVGASLLLRWSSRFKGPAAWVRWASFGLLGSWALSAVPALGLPLAAGLSVLLPLILVFSATWAASHLSLESDVQERTARDIQPRVIGVLNALFIAGAAATAFLFGRLLDWLALASGFFWINASFAALAVLVWLAARRLRRP